MAVRLFPALSLLLGITAASLVVAPERTQAASPSVSPPSVGVAGDTLEELASQATRAVVRIDAETPSGSKQGSGFIVDSTGRILTNHHVVRDARSVRVRLASGDIYDRVSVLTVDGRRDIAVLQIPGYDLPWLSLGNSDSVRVGSEVIAIGSPLGLENTVSTGIVSGRREEAEGYRVLQISAPTSEGSSGGPVMSRRGEVIGIAVSQMRDGQNLNFAVPINYARGLLTHLDDEAVTWLAPSSPLGRSSGQETSAETEPVNTSLRFDLESFGGYDIEMEGNVGEQRHRRTRITYRRIESVGDREARIERYRESETTERSGTFDTPQIVLRERSRTIVSASDFRPVSAQGEVSLWTGGEWQTTEYRLRFDGHHVRGTRRDSAGQVEEVDRELPRGVILREMRNLAFASLAADSLLGRSVELVTFDPLTGQLESDRYDVRGTTTVRIDGRPHDALEVNVATGLSNSTAYFRRDRPRVLLRTESGSRGFAEVVTRMEMFSPSSPPEAETSGRSSS